MRGEHELPDQAAGSLRGSSPRARGARVVTIALTGFLGIIPACAGSTAPRADRVLMSRDHPRVRGEHAVLAGGDQVGGGSSPRARGARGKRHDGDTRRGIIPACAGSTARSRMVRPARRDHPRVRGEHSLASPRRSRHQGSSPRARGAHAAPYPPGGAGDHPRVRGEHSIAPCTRTTTWGSSPRARGARLRDRYRSVARGIIPACAGSTRCPACLSARSGDHPRVRGEHACPPLTTV